VNPLGRFRFRHLIDGAPEAVFAMLRDVERIAEWVPRVDRSHLLAREGGVSVCELVFRGAARSVTLELVYLDDQSIRFTQVDLREGDCLQGEVRNEAEPYGAGCLLDLHSRWPGWGICPWHLRI